MYIALYDEAASLISFPYDIEAGERTAFEPHRLRRRASPRTSSGRSEPLVLGTEAEQLAMGGIGAIDVGDESYLGVPILVGERVLGVISIASASTSTRSPRPTCGS